MMVMMKCLRHEGVEGQQEAATMVFNIVGVDDDGDDEVFEA